MSARDELKEILDEIVCPFGNSHEATKRKVYALFKQLRAATAPTERIVTVTEKDPAQEAEIRRLKQEVASLRDKLTYAESRADRAEAKLNAEVEEHQTNKKTFFGALPGLQHKGEKNKVYYQGQLVGICVAIQDAADTISDKAIKRLIEFWFGMVHDRIGTNNQTLNWAASGISFILNAMSQESESGAKAAKRIADVMHVSQYKRNVIQSKWIPEAIKRHRRRHEPGLPVVKRVEDEPEDIKPGLPRMPKFQTVHEAFYRGMLMGICMMAQRVFESKSLSDDVFTDIFGFWSRSLHKRMGRENKTTLWAASALAEQLNDMTKFSPEGAKVAEWMARVMKTPEGDFIKSVQVNDEDDDDDEPEADRGGEAGGTDADGEPGPVQ